MCDYCEGNKAFEAEYTGKGIHTAKRNIMKLLSGYSEINDSIAYIKDGILFADTSSGEYAELGFKINYCPNCGAKMPEERSKHIVIDLDVPSDEDGNLKSGVHIHL